MPSTDLNTYVQDTLGSSLDFPVGTSPQAIAALAEMTTPPIDQDYSAANSPTSGHPDSPVSAVGRFSNLAPWLVGGSVLALVGAGFLVWLK